METIETKKTEEIKKETRDGHVLNSNNEKFSTGEDAWGFGNVFKPYTYDVFFSADKGLCGGMVFAVKDYHEGHIMLPRVTKAPTVETNVVLLNYLCERQRDSVLQPSVRKYFWMPKCDQYECEKYYLKIKEDILGNHLSVLGLIRAQSVMDITKNHQVCAYAFTEDEANNVTLSIYDPIRPGSDNVSISFNYKAFSGFTCNPLDLGPIYSIFHPTYTYKDPPNIEVNSEDASVNFLSQPLNK